MILAVFITVLTAKIKAFEIIMIKVMLLLIAEDMMILCMF